MQYQIKGEPIPACKELFDPTNQYKAKKRSQGFLLCDLFDVYRI